jgi:ABC-type Na+ efflux pump permease subunit
VSTAKGKSNSKGNYKLSLKAPSKPGKYKYRVTARAGKYKLANKIRRLTALTSHTRTITITKAAASTPSGSTNINSTPTTLTESPTTEQTPETPETTQAPSPQMPSAPPTERESLIALYNSTNGPGWTDNTSWDTNAPVCT